MLAVILVCLLEFAVLRTGLFRRAAYWISMVIVFGFQILVDGWLTKLSRADRRLQRAPHQRASGFPFDIPVEDFLFGWAMVTAVLLLWERQRLRDRDEKRSELQPAACPRRRPRRVRRGRGRLRQAGRRATPDITHICAYRRSA